MFMTASVPAMAIAASSRIMARIVFRLTRRDDNRPRVLYGDASQV